MKVLTIHHAQVTVPPGSSDAVRDFYGRLLGLAELPVPPSLMRFGLIWFKVGDREIHVGIEKDKKDRTPAHLAYEVDDILNARRRLAAEGFEVHEQPVIDGYDRFHTFDPFGNRVELIGRVVR